MESQVTWNILGRAMTPYAVCVWIGCLAALALFFWQGRRLKTSAKLCTAGLGILLGLFFARLFYVAAKWKTFTMNIGLESFFATPDEDLRAWGTGMGAAFWGAVGGVALAAAISGAVTKQKISAILDALAPSAALGIAISRFGEFSIGEGIGPDVYEEGLQFFPLAVMNEWEEWYYALFLLEGLVGVIIFLVLLFPGRKWTGGYRARAFLILYSSCQIVLEALRRDSYLRWLFVRVNQITCALVLLGLVVFGIIRWAKRRPAVRMPTKRLVWNIVFFVLMVPVIILMEFDVDKGWLGMEGWMNYLIEAVCCVVMGVSSWNLAMKN